MGYQDEQPEPKEVLEDRYELQSIIGSGGMATIYRARDLQLDRIVAVKVLHEIYSADPLFVRRFLREARTALSLKHSNIVRVYDFVQTDGHYFIVMELVEGTDLRSYLTWRKVLDVDRSIIIAHDVALGLGAAHRRGIVHRDVKPQNVLIGTDGSIKLTDFGIVSIYNGVDVERLTTSGMTLGTVQYYAPEQAQGEIVTPAADVYSLGIVMYEMLTGNPPFDGDSVVVVAMQHIQDQPVPPGQLNPYIPAELENIILRCLEKHPGDRFSDGSELARALEKFGDATVAETLSVTPGSIPTSSTQTPSSETPTGLSDTLKIVRLPASSDKKELDPVASSNHSHKSNSLKALLHNWIHRLTHL
jgi:serine/threonine-protein kinase